MIQTIFVVPYRNRECQKHFFEKYMSYLMEDTDPSTYEVVFAHQKNELPFNRGGVKNIGFLYAKEKYPHYKDIVFVFNDIDTLPYKKGHLNYTLRENEIKHYYGFKYCLGGIMAIRGKDFERINGFPSFWNWGWEDTILYERAIAAQMIINRDQYVDFGNHTILHLNDGPTRDISLKMYREYQKGNIQDGLSTLRHVKYEKNELLDIVSFVCSYYPFDTSVKNLYLKGQEPDKKELPKEFQRDAVPTPTFIRPRSRMMRY